MSDWVAMVDDDISALRMASHVLTEEGIRVSSLKSGSELISFLKYNRPDLLLLDIHMPVMDGFETMDVLENNGELKNIPVIFLTGDEDSETEIRGLHAGAFDFLKKPFVPEILLLRVRHALELAHKEAAREASEAASAKKKKQSEAERTDPLTGLLNKVAVQQEIDHLCRQWQGALLVINLDDFSLINSVYGREKGNSILKDFSAVIRKVVRSTDIVGHMNGDEFVAYCPNTRNEAVIKEKSVYMNRELNRILEEHLGKEMSVSSGISTGAVMAPDEGRDFITLYQKAEEAMYLVKKEGTHGLRFYWRNRRPDGRRVSGCIQIMESLYEEKTVSDALLLPLEEFRLIFRLFVRMNLNRPLDSCFLVMYLSPAEGTIGDMEMVKEHFLKMLTSSLRSSDIITSRGNDTFMIMLPRTALNDGKTVVKRLMMNWEENSDKELVQLRWEMDLIQ